MSAIKGNPPPQGGKSWRGGGVLFTCTGWGQSGPLVLGQWHGALRSVSLARRLLSSILGRSPQGLAATRFFGSDPGWLSPQNPVYANNPSTLGAFIFQSSSTERLALNSAQKHSASPLFVKGPG